MDDTQDLHHQQQLEQQQIEEQIQDLVTQAKSAMVYCDKFAAAIKDALNRYDPDGIIAGCGRVHWDLDPTNGYLVSTKKVLFAADMFGRRYKITVEEA
jgi:acetyl-CoA carboxylase carboxyltransferase component